MRTRLLAALLAAAPLGARAAPFGGTQAGTSGAAFLTLGADARAAGMGNAVDASADDATALYWNPADLASLRYRDATFTHAASYQSTFYDFLAYAQPIEARGASDRERGTFPDQLGAIGGTVQYQNSGKLNEVDNTGTATGGSFTPQNLAATVGWGAELARGLDAGVAFKYVESQIVETAATGAVDFGARWRSVVPGTEAGFSLAANVRNLGGGLKFSYVSDPLPLAFVIGSALHPLRSLTVDLDVTAPRDAAPYVSVGVEWRAPMTAGLTASLRAGYNGNATSNDFGAAFGGGLGFERLSFDYAWTPTGGLGTSQRLSLSCRF